MLACPADQQLQYFACGAVIQLVRAANDAREALGRGDACRAVAAALQNFPRDARVCEYACRAALKLATGDAENKARFFRLGPKPLAEQARTRFAANATVAGWAERLIKEL